MTRSHLPVSHKTLYLIVICLSILAPRIVAVSIKHQEHLGKSVTTAEECKTLEELLEKYQGKYNQGARTLKQPTELLKALDEIKDMLNKFKEIDLSPSRTNVTIELKTDDKKNTGGISLLSMKTNKPLQTFRAIGENLEVIFSEAPSNVTERSRMMGVIKEKLKTVIAEIKESLLDPQNDIRERLALEDEYLEALKRMEDRITDMTRGDREKLQLFNDMIANYKEMVLKCHQKLTKALRYTMVPNKAHRLAGLQAGNNTNTTNSTNTTASSAESKVQQLQASSPLSKEESNCTVQQLPPVDLRLKDADNEKEKVIYAIGGRIRDFDGSKSGEERLAPDSTRQSERPRQVNVQPLQMAPQEMPTLVNPAATGMNTGLPHKKFHAPARDREDRGLNNLRAAPDASFQKEPEKKEPRQVVKPMEQSDDRVIFDRVTFDAVRKRKVPVSVYDEGIVPAQQIPKSPHSLLMNPAAPVSPDDALQKMKPTQQTIGDSVRPREDDQTLRSFAKGFERSGVIDQIRSQMIDDIMPSQFDKTLEKSLDRKVFSPQNAREETMKPSTQRQEDNRHVISRQIVEEAVPTRVDASSQKAAGELTDKALKPTQKVDEQMLPKTPDPLRYDGKEPSLRVNPVAPSEHGSIDGAGNTLNGSNPEVKNCVPTPKKQPQMQQQVSQSADTLSQRITQDDVAEVKQIASTALPNHWTQTTKFTTSFNRVNGRPTLMNRARALRNPPSDDGSALKNSLFNQPTVNMAGTAFPRLLDPPPNLGALASNTTLQTNMTTNKTNVAGRTSRAAVNATAEVEEMHESTAAANTSISLKTANEQPGIKNWNLDQKPITVSFPKGSNVPEASKPAAAPLVPSTNTVKTTNDTPAPALRLSIPAPPEQSKGDGFQPPFEATETAPEAISEPQADQLALKAKEIQAEEAKLQALRASILDGPAQMINSQPAKADDWKKSPFEDDEQELKALREKMDRLEAELKGKEPSESMTGR